MPPREPPRSQDPDRAPAPEPGLPAEEMRRDLEAPQPDPAGVRTSGRWRAYLRSLLGDG